MSANAALAASRDARNQHLRGNIQMNGDGFGQAEFAAPARPGISPDPACADSHPAGSRMRNPAAEFCAATIWLTISSPTKPPDLRMEHASPAQIRAGFAFGAKHLAGGDSGDMETPGNQSGLSAFAAAGRSEEQDDHGGLRDLKPVLQQTGFTGPIIFYQRVISECAPPATRPCCRAGRTPRWRSPRDREEASRQARRSAAGIAQHAPSHRDSRQQPDEPAPPRRPARRPRQWRQATRNAACVTR